MRLASPISAASPRESERNASWSSASAIEHAGARGGLQVGAVAEPERAQHALQPAGERRLVVAVGRAQPRRQFAPEPERAVARALAVALREGVEQPADRVGPALGGGGAPLRRAPPSAPRTPRGSGRRAPRRSPPCRAGTGTASRPRRRRRTPRAWSSARPVPRRRAVPPPRRASAPAAPASAPGAAPGAAAGRRAAGGLTAPRAPRGGALARAHGAVHVAVPVASRSPCPPSGCCRPARAARARARPACPARRCRPGRRGPALGRPARLEVLARLRACRRSTCANVAERGVAPLGRATCARSRAPCRRRRSRTARRASRPRASRRTSTLTEAVERHGGAVQALLAPERLVVDGGDLRQRALAACAA